MSVARESRRMRLRVFVRIRNRGIFRISIRQACAFPINENPAKTNVGQRLPGETQSSGILKNPIIPRILILTGCARPQARCGREDSAAHWGAPICRDSRALPTAFAVRIPAFGGMTGLESGNEGRNRG